MLRRTLLASLAALTLLTYAPEAPAANLVNRPQPLSAVARREPLRKAAQATRRLAGRLVNGARNLFNCGR